MILLLNGSFGIGKTTVARRLRRLLPGSGVFDPEMLGSALLLIPRSRALDDYQDLPSWRGLTVLGIRIARLFHPTVIVPMAFTNLDHLNAIRRGAARCDREVRHFCLIADIEVVRERLSRRAAEQGGAPTDWQLRRAAECCAVHRSREFEVQVPAAGRTADEIAADIAARLIGQDLTRPRAP